ncbi:hypothetical protein BECAL_02554 [Bellilinea caldifistulae]|uniref:Uncharacterized protein n=1 Tax=Bellilinea caldifistulae TaxID=360411 RepID=A0A0P6XSQ2_9CHLR|nr:hypothetical protein [Bellilinea caldifistulae]KPL75823.1 hypothetical protein AC812_07520 [Bellilinea caldifistulae]GAP11366.1 hypothetical protein BECAL_02554 [Bellilinea caldifistulae]GIV64928.1 MAG: hypothetical protein KatS3mg046_188 [Bellilinea sp.]
MGSGSNRKGEIFFLLIIGIAFALLLYFGSDFGSGFSFGKSAGWDPFTPILKGLSGLGQAITQSFSRILP